jgi:hypothetical protein
MQKPGQRVTGLCRGAGAHGDRLHAISTRSPSCLHPDLVTCCVARAAVAADWGMDAMRRVGAVVALRFSFWACPEGR